VPAAATPQLRWQSAHRHGINSKHTSKSPTKSENGETKGGEGADNEKKDRSQVEMARTRKLTSKIAGDEGESPVLSYSRRNHLSLAKPEGGNQK